MSRFNTGNPLGSGDPRDLDDNAKNMDLAVNSEDSQWIDRFGRPRLPLMEQERQFVADQARREDEFQDSQDNRDDAFDASQASRETRFNDFIASSGYQFAGDYGPGIEITEYNQLIRDSNGEFWRVSGQVELPYVTTGAGIPEDDALVPAGDAVLRQDLANPAKGAAMVARGVVAVDSIADLLALPEGQRKEGLRYLVAGGGAFYWDADDLSGEVAADIFQGIYLPLPGSDGSTGAFVRESGAINARTTIRVGAGERFETINQAIKNLAGTSTDGDGYIRLLLKSGFVMQEQIIVRNVDLGRFVIESEDAVVPIRRSAITISPTSENFQPIFFGWRYSTLPFINCLFEYDNTGVAGGQSGAWVEGASKVYLGPSSGVKSCPGRGLHVSNNSIGYARGTIWDGSGIGLRVSNGSVCQFRSASAQNCEFGAALQGSIVNLIDSNFSNAAVRGVSADGCTIFGPGLIAKDCGEVGFTGTGGSVSIPTSDLSGCGTVGFSAAVAGAFNLDGSDISNSVGDAVRATGGAVVSVKNADLSNPGGYAVFATELAQVSSRGANCSGAGAIAFYAARGSRIDASETLTGPGLGYLVATGGQIYAYGTTGTTGQPSNTLTPSGVIYNGRSTSFVLPIPATTLMAGEVAEFDIDAPGVSIEEYTVAMVNKNIRGAIIWSYVDAADSIKVFIKNETSNSITINAGNIKVKVV